jgi:hypothetical protein
LAEASITTTNSEFRGEAKTLKGISSGGWPPQRAGWCKKKEEVALTTCSATLQKISIHNKTRFISNSKGKNNTSG